MASNPIELLISMDVNRGKSKANIDDYISSLKKHYDRNPLLVTVGFNKSRLDNEIKELNKILSNKKVELDLSIKNGDNKVFASLEKQIDGILNKVKQLNTQLNSIGGKANATGDLGKSVAEIEKLKNSNMQAVGQVQALQRELGKLSSGVNSAGIATRELTKNTDGFTSALGRALPKFGLWIVAANAIYAPIRGIQDLTRQVIELDTAITDLARVSNLPDFQLERVLENSIKNVDELSAKTKDYLELVNEFSRTGKNDTESLALANTATILQNISDLNAKESFDSLTAAQIAFNIEAERSIEIADKLNEVDNNYSITTKDLSLSLNKAASTAATFGRLMPTWEEISSIKTSHIGRTHWV